ncbi:PaREP1 family protein [Pyrofollis japonicus]|nr:PaREP1 family protein [Pyrofollis japonicus]
MALFVLSTYGYIFIHPSKELYMGVFLSSEALTIKIPRSIAQRLEADARRIGLSIEEYVLELITRGLDPEERVNAYIEAAQALLEQALQELAKGDTRQAVEKTWGAAALAIKAYAEWRDGIRITSHRELWEYRRTIEKELGDWVYDAWMAANGMHTCFYEGWCSAEDVREAIKRVRRLVDEVASRIKKS